MSVLFRREPSGSAGAARAAERGLADDRPNAAQLDEITKIVEQRLVTVEFQPIVNMATGKTVGFETFARGPANSPLATPQAMFRAAAAAGLIGELDLVAANASFAAARFSPQLNDLTFFLNTDPAGLTQQRSQELLDTAMTAIAALRIVIELPEHALVRDPVGTIAAADQLRQAGAKIAIDNVGSTAQGLALIPFLRPEVIKLSPQVVASPVQRMAQIMDAVVSYTERSSGLIVAQGIEQDAHARSAIGMGAVLGQGYLYGHPMTVPVAKGEQGEPLEVERTDEPVDLTTTPYEMLAADRTASRVDTAMFDALATRLMDRAEAGAEPFVMLIAGTDTGYLAGGRSSRLRTLGSKASLLLLLTTATDLVATREQTVARLEDGDRLRDERVMAVVSPYDASILVAKPVEGGYDCMLSHDRSLVMRAARGMLARVTPSPAATV
jgi:EAL domain-containing protein (putative c-di-GMP-specific phosphodiesterase class I)